MYFRPIVHFDGLGRLGYSRSFVPGLGRRGCGCSATAFFGLRTGEGFINLGFAAMVWRRRDARRRNASRGLFVVWGHGGTRDAGGYGAVVPSRFRSLKFEACPASRARLQGSHDAPRCAARHGADITRNMHTDPYQCAYATMEAKSSGGNRNPACRPSARRGQLVGTRVPRPGNAATATVSARRVSSARKVGFPELARNATGR